MISANATSRFRPRTSAALCAAALTLAALAGCAEDGGQPGPQAPSAQASKPSTSPSPKRAAFDPPTAFDNAPPDISTAISTAARNPAVTLHDGAAYITGDDELAAYDTGTGKELWTEPTKHPAHQGGFGESANEPFLTSEGGKDIVLAAWNRTVQGEGTAPDRAVIELTAREARTGALVWEAEVTPKPREADTEQDRLLPGGVTEAQIVAVTEDSVVVNDNAITYVVDRASSELRWHKPLFQAVTVADGVVAGSEAGDERGQGRLVGYAENDGKQRWTALEGGTPAASHAGPTALAGGNSDELALVDARDGSVLTRVKNTQGHLHTWSCQWDKQATTVCTDQLGSQVNSLVGFDATSGKELWSLTAEPLRSITPEGRLVPSVSTVWHGAVYAATGNGALVLDAHTGEDRATDLDIVPENVDQYAALTTENGINVYRAVG